MHLFACNMFIIFSSYDCYSTHARSRIQVSSQDINETLHEFKTTDPIFKGEKSAELQFFGKKNSKIFVLSSIISCIYIFLGQNSVHLYFADNDFSFKFRLKINIFCIFLQK